MIFDLAMTGETDEKGLVSQVLAEFRRPGTASQGPVCRAIDQLRAAREEAERPSTFGAHRHCVRVSRAEAAHRQARSYSSYLNESASLVR
jgi:hypothetical protein